MDVSTATQRRIHDKIKECIAKAKAHYGVEVKFPHIKYTNAAGRAGTASYGKNLMTLSGLLLNDPANVEEMINDTVVHEMGHFICDAVHPEIRDQAFERRLHARLAGVRAAKTESHGPKWKSVMRVLGGNPERTHDMQVSDHLKHLAKGAGNVRTDWKCPHCSYVFSLGPKQDAKNRSGQAKYYCNKCRTSTKQYLVPVDGAAPLRPYQQDAMTQLMERIANSTLTVTDLTGKKPVVTTYPPIKQPEPLWPQIAGRATRPVVPEPVKPVGGGSKIDLCWLIYRTRPNLSRAELIKFFVAQAGCTPAGASTYVATCKKRYEQGER